MEEQLLIAESLLDWIEIKMRELRFKDFSEDEREKKYKTVAAFIKGYRARDRKLNGLLLQEEWLKVREEAFSYKERLH
jgi:hypothetical protein